MTYQEAEDCQLSDQIGEGAARAVPVKGRQLRPKPVIHVVHRAQVDQPIACDHASDACPRKREKKD